MRTLLAIPMLLVVLALPALAQGQTAQPPAQCRCFCATENGAFDRGLVTLEQCQSACQSVAGGSRVLSCSNPNDLSSLPGNNPRCFDAATTACTDQGGEHGMTQPAECPTGWRYCYPAQTAAIPLTFALGGVTSVQNVGNYIAAGYTFLLGIGTTVAIVLVMVGGAQYALSRGRPESVSQAKERIKNAVIGLVLLAASYVILFTVNPDLVRLQVPRLPMMKSVAFLGQGSTCDFLEAGGYTIDNKGRAKACGIIGEITAGPPGSGVASGATCQWSTCPAGNRCLGAGDKAQCVACEDYAQQKELGLEVNGSLCAALREPHTPNAAGDVDIANFCFLAFDGDLTEDRTNGSCAALHIDCKSISSCSGYETVIAVSGSKSTEMENVEPGGNIAGMVDDIDIQTLCTMDPCRIGRKKGGRCEYSTGALGASDDCILQE